jgi:hypothetical protein
VLLRPLSNLKWYFLEEDTTRTALIISTAEELIFIAHRRILSLEIKIEIEKRDNLNGSTGRID